MSAGMAVPCKAGREPEACMAFAGARVKKEGAGWGPRSSRRRLFACEARVVRGTTGGEDGKSAPIAGKGGMTCVARDVMWLGRQARLAFPKPRDAAVGAEDGVACKIDALARDAAWLVVSG